MTSDSLSNDYTIKFSGPPLMKGKIIIFNRDVTELGTILHKTMREEDGQNGSNKDLEKIGSLEYQIRKEWGWSIKGRLSNHLGFL